MTRDVVRWLLQLLDLDCVKSKHVLSNIDYNFSEHLDSLKRDLNGTEPLWDEGWFFESLEETITQRCSARKNDRLLSRVRRELERELDTTEGNHD